MTTRTLQELAQEALEIQGACNLCGLVQSFARALIDLNALSRNDGTTERNQHPIVIVWLDKLNSLAGIQDFGNKADMKISRAYNQVENMANYLQIPPDSL